MTRYRKKGFGTCSKCGHNCEALVSEMRVCLDRANEIADTLRDHGIAVARNGYVSGQWEATSKKARPYEDHNCCYPTPQEKP
jgi:hypothetical protein